jgi:hypothetical protein
MGGQYLFGESFNSGRGQMADDVGGHQIPCFFLRGAWDTNTLALILVFGGATN